MPRDLEESLVRKAQDGGGGKVNCGSCMFGLAAVTLAQDAEKSRVRSGRN